MPTSDEIVRNRPLSGQELKAIIMKDVEFILSRDGMFSLTMGYGRISYEVRVSMHMDNPAYSEHMVRVLSHSASRQEIESKPELSALEPAPPLKDTSGESLVMSRERSRVIDSPNHARLQNNLPITIGFKNPESGVVEEREVHYDNTNLPPAGSIEDRDTTGDAGREWMLTLRKPGPRKEN